MIRNIRVEEAGIDLAYEAFAAAFADYEIPLSMNREQFEEHMFQKERHLADSSYVAMDGNRPAGIILSGCREYKGQLSMRCGALGISPPYRGEGVAQQLLKLHKEAAIRAGCTQLVLEVICGNERAERFYRKQGYTPAGKLTYFRCPDPQTLAEMMHSVPGPEATLELEILPLEQPLLLELIREWGGVCSDWQSGNEYLYPNPELMVWGCRLGRQWIGAIAVNRAGKICLLAVDKQYRRSGAATALLQTAAARSGAGQLAATTLGEPEAEDFLLARGFGRLPLEQWRMTSPLG